MAAKYTTEQVIAAIKASKGLVHIAARQLGCTPQTIYNHAKKTEAVRQALTDERGFVVDTAELALMKAIQNGEAWAVCFLLKTLGKDRGYVERQEHSGANGKSIPYEVTVRVVYDDAKPTAESSA